ncbi:MAG: hypothetical protein N2515_04065 [Deltaproteobacteria bacterium]|nr:hypothetical protein [Sandaracinaceae bacterium]MCX7807761.1 hypothetical protein [Deltaproteobacteria bacterium]MDW8247075.1 hypothetical protein [Sandaracinaceae bacterium]
MQRRVESDQVLEHQVRVAREVVESGALEGMQKHELLEKIGPGRRCGFVEMCAQRGFSPEDWVYDIGRAPENPGLPAGPMILVGFDSAGRVLRTFWIARGAPRPAR